MKNRILSLLIAMALMLSLLTFTASAESTINATGIPEDATKFDTNFGYIFNNSTGRLDIYGTGELKSGRWQNELNFNDIKKVVFHNGITSLPDGLFGHTDGVSQWKDIKGGTCTDYKDTGNKNLTAVTLPATLTKLGMYVFCNRAGIKEINYFSENELSTTEGLPTRLETIGKQCFQNLYGWDADGGHLVIPASVKTLGANAFALCKLIDMVTFASGSMLESVGMNTFAGLALNAFVVFPDGFTFNGADALGWTECDDTKSVSYLRLFTTNSTTKTNLDNVHHTDSKNYAVTASLVANSTVVDYGSIPTGTGVPNAGRWIVFGSGDKLELHIFGYGGYGGNNPGNVNQTEYPWNTDKVDTSKIAKIAFHNGLTITPVFLSNVFDGSAKDGNMVGVKELVLPYGLEKLTNKAFCGMQNLESISHFDAYEKEIIEGLPDQKLTYIDTLALGNIFKAKFNIVVPACVETVENAAFSSFGINNGNVPVSVVFAKDSKCTTFGNDPYSHCKAHFTGEVPGSVTNWSAPFSADFKGTLYIEGTMPTSCALGSKFPSENDVNVTTKVIYYDDSWDNTFGKYGTKASPVLDAKITNSEDAGKITASVTYRAPEKMKNDEEYALIIAQYDTNNAMVAVDYTTGTIYKDSTSIETPISYSVAADAGAVTTKAFLWETNTLRPLALAQDGKAPERTGELAGTDAQWIAAGTTIDWTKSDLGAAPYLRKKFSTDAKKISKATAYVTGLGYYELYLNGKKVGDKVLEPFISLYGTDAVYYSTYDVTNMIQNGDNAVGALLGRGNYYNYTSTNSIASNTTYDRARNRQRLIMRLVISYNDGTQDEVVTDGTWKWSDSPILVDQPAYGEYYDAGCEIDGWATAGFDDASWKTVKDESSIKATQGELVKAPSNYNKVMAVHNPESVTKSSESPGTYIFDMGRVMTGWANISVVGNKGETVTVKYYEDINKKSVYGKKITLNNKEIEGQTDYYVLKGDSKGENWSPKFTLKSFRYIVVSGYPEGMTEEQIKNSIKAEEIYVNVESIGTFESSNERFNKIHEMSRNTLLNNMHSFISDTPVFENLGYLYDGTSSSEWGLYNFDMAEYLEKWSRDIRATQDNDGGMSPYAPSLGASKALSGPEWTEMGICELPWILYNRTGDIDILSENYDNMVALVDFESGKGGKVRADKQIGTRLRKSLPDGIYYSYWGDHVPPTQLSSGRVSRYYSITATAYVYRATEILVQTAKILGKTGDVIKYTALAEQIKKNFNEWFYDAEKGYYHDGKLAEYYMSDSEGPTNKFGQTPQLVALAFGLTTDENREKVLSTLVNNSTQLKVGLIGTRHIFEVFSENGYINKLYDIINTDEYPGYGYWIENGATSLWEYWEKDNRSQNHSMFGTIDNLFYRYIAGIREDKAGYITSIIKPSIPEGMTYASASTRTKYGDIKSSWNKSNEQLKLKIKIPQGTTATVYVPLIFDSANVECDKSATYLRREAGYAIYSVNAGEYEFVVK